MLVNIAGHGAIPGLGVLAPVYGKDLSDKDVIRLLNFNHIRVYQTSTGLLVTKSNVNGMLDAAANITVTTMTTPTVSEESVTEPVVEEKVIKEVTEEPTIEEVIEEDEITDVVEDVTAEEIEEEIIDTETVAEETEEEDIVEEETITTPVTNNNNQYKNNNNQYKNNKNKNKKR